MTIKEQHTASIHQFAKQLGFDFCGISRAEFLEDEAPRLEKWLNQGMHGKMGYMANHFDKRLDPTKLVEGAKSVISLIYNHYPAAPNQDEMGYKIAKYAYGEDYHFVVKDKLKEFFSLIQNGIDQDVSGRVFVDSAPVHERAWAAKSGLGWVGKNSLLLNRSMGSFFFIAEIILDLDLVADGPIKDYCGTCSKCMDACPTDAIPEPYVVDASKCISYLTIELKDEIPDEFSGKMEDWIFGCDICQDVCPWNRFSKTHHESRFDKREIVKSKKQWEDLTEETFRVIFKNSAVKRTKYSGLMRNILFAKKKSR